MRKLRSAARRRVLFALRRASARPKQAHTAVFPNGHCRCELLSLDGKIWRTLGLLRFRPVFLALEYAAGRRRLYINPLRVLIVAIVVYVLAT